jgi:heterodisulfide reductase subunit A
MPSSTRSSPPWTCEFTCPYDAITKVEEGGKEIAAISRTACKGCGGCVPVCPSDAIDLQGYTDAQIRSMIDGMLEVVCQ